MKTVQQEVTVVDFSSDGEKRCLQLLVGANYTEKDAKEFLEKWLVSEEIPFFGYAQPASFLTTEEGVQKVLHALRAVIYSN